jgi:RNA recognition motif-containing protein
METKIENKLVCRKCGGGHITVKCQQGKEPINTIITSANTNTYVNTDTNVNSFYNANNYKTKREYKKNYRVKINNLPSDITDEEMMELTSQWGHITKIKVLNYPDSSISYIDFGYEEEADYFIKALDKTPFDYTLLSVSKAEIL